MRTVCIEITRECNLSCPYCHASANESTEPSKYLTATQWKEGLDKVLDLARLNITGGEPLLPIVWPKTLEIARYAVARGVEVKINTNGTHGVDFGNLPTDLVRFQVSIDGPEKVHDKLRGKGVYKKAVEFLEQCYTLGYPLEIKGVIVDPDEATAAIDYATELASKYEAVFLFQLMARFGRGKALEDKASKKRRDLDVMVKDKERVFIKGEVKVCTGILGNGGQFANIDEHGYFIPCSQLRHLRTDINILDPDYSEIKARVAIRQVARGASCSC